MNIPMISSFYTYIQGKVSNSSWTPVTDLYSNSYKYDLEYKKSTDSSYNSVTNIASLSKKLYNLLGNTTYNFRVRAKLTYKYIIRTMLVGSTRTMLVGSTRDMIPETSETLIGDYSTVLTKTTKYNMYISGYNNELIEIPAVFSETSNYSLPVTQESLTGLKSRWTITGGKNNFEIETRPVEYAVYLKILGYIKSRMSQKETIYVYTLKKEIQAFIDITDINRNQQGDSNLYSMKIKIEEV